MSEERVCYICNGNRFVDGHHYDCCEGKLSPETVPLCRRCHRTYHDWGVGAFSPDTTERALEVENKRREILRSLPPEHPLYQSLQFSREEARARLKMEDVKRSRYWYKKHGIVPPSRLGTKKLFRGIPVKIPSNPLCGQDWIEAHLTDHTAEEIEALTINIAYDDRWLPPVLVSDKKGTLKMRIRALELP